MRTRLRDRWPVLLMPLMFWGLDTVLTYGRQPPRVERTADNVHELNPVVARALVSGVGVELLLQASWILVIAVPVLLLPRFLAAWYAYAWSFGHAAGGAVWLIYPFGYGLGYWTLYWYCPVVGLVFLWVAQRMFQLRPQTERTGARSEQVALEKQPRE